MPSNVGLTYHSLFTRNVVSAERVNMYTRRFGGSGHNTVIQFWFFVITSIY